MNGNTVETALQRNIVDEVETTIATALKSFANALYID